MPIHPPTEQEERDRVLAYLRSHPDLLDRHPDLLADLIIPHGAGSASLIERQVQVLRERAAARGVRFELTQAAGHEIVEHLLAGRADLGLTAPRPEVDELGWTGLYRQQLCLAVPDGHSLAGREHVALADAGDEPFVTLQAPIGLRRLTDELCARAGLTPRFAFESTEIGTLEGFVAAGLGVAIVPQPRPQRAEPGVRYLPITDDSAHRMIGLSRLRGRPLPPVVDRFARFVAARFRDGVEAGRGRARVW